MEFSSWLTPSSLFLLLNLIIGTIVLTAKLGARKHHNHNQDQFHGQAMTHQLGRATSGLLDRVKSINLSLYKFDSTVEPDRPTAELVRAPSLLDRLRSFRNSADPQTHTDTHDDHLVKRSKSEHTKNEVMDKETKVMTRSASEKGPEMGDNSKSKEEEDEIAIEKRRPATTMGRLGEAEDIGVDAQADDFINRFKHQLRLQRMDSLKRFREMIAGRGNASHTT